MHIESQKYASVEYVEEEEWDYFDINEGFHYEFLEDLKGLERAARHFEFKR